MVVIIPPRPPPDPPDPDPGPGPTDPIPPHINRPSRPCKMTNKNLHLSSPILAGHPRKNTPFEHFEVDIFHFFARSVRSVGPDQLMFIYQSASIKISLN